MYDVYAHKKIPECFFLRVFHMCEPVQNSQLFLEIKKLFFSILLSDAAFLLCGHSFYESAQLAQLAQPEAVQRCAYWEEEVEAR